MRRIITTWGVATLLILGLSINVDAQEGSSVTVGGGFLEAGTHTLASEPTGELEGRTCDVVIDVTNNESVWPGNSLRVESGSGALVLEGVEDGANADTHGTGQLTLGPTIDVILVVAEGSSLTAVVSWVCPPIVTTTTTPETTTTVPETTTTLPDDANWSASSTCDTVTVEFGEGILQVDAYENDVLLESFTESGTLDAVVGSRTEIELLAIPAAGFAAVPEIIVVFVDDCIPDTTIPPTTPSTPPGTLPFTGTGETAGIVAAAVALLGLGGLMLRSIRED